MKHRRFSFKAQRDLFLLLAYILAAGLFLSFSSGGFVVNFRRIGFSVVSGIQRGVYSCASFFSGTVNAVRELSDLREKYRALEKRLENYEVMQRSNAEIRRENERLRELLAFTENLPHRNIPAEIIGRDPSNMYSGITVNKGARHGIRKNMTVIAFQNSPAGGLVGKVVQVGVTTAMIMPLYDFQCYIPARLEDTRFHGLVNGQGDAESPLVMRYVPKRGQGEIRAGERIVTSGESRTYPAGISVGIVSGITSNDYENSIEILVQPAVDFAKLDTVFLLDPEEDGGGDAT